ncbi:hypothetical protein ACQP2K_10740 [Microbispora siamensis]
MSGPGRSFPTDCHRPGTLPGDRPASEPEVTNPVSQASTTA